MIACDFVEAWSSRHKNHQKVFKKACKNALTLIDADEDPREEGLERQRASLGQVLVQLRVGQGDGAGHVFVQDQGEDREHGVDGGVADHQSTGIQRHGAEVERRREYRLQKYGFVKTHHMDVVIMKWIGMECFYLHGCNDQPPMNDKLAEGGRPLVRVSSMDQYEFGNMGELSQGKVGRQRSLLPLFAHDADPNRGSLESKLGMHF